MLATFGAKQKRKRLIPVPNWAFTHLRIRFRSDPSLPSGLFWNLIDPNVCVRARARMNFGSVRVVLKFPAALAYGLIFSRASKHEGIIYPCGASLL